MYRSSFSDTPLLRVSRPVSACSRCRSAKVKCDGKLPACTACEKAGRKNECSSANDQFARGKERSYVAALELRIEKLERRLTYARSRRESLALHESDTPPPTAVDRKDSLAHIKAAIHRKAERRRENADVNTLVSDFGFLSVNATTRDFEPSMHNMTFARLVLAASTNAVLPAPPTGWLLPARQPATALIDYYSNNIHTLFPAFNESTIRKVLDDVYHQSERPIQDHEHWLFFMVLAVASAAQSCSARDEFYHNGVTFAGMAMRYAEQSLVPGSAAQIQSLILLTLYSMLDPEHFDSWHLIGVTARACIDLGYHQDPPPEQMPDMSVLEMRRRLFYCVYALDRAISMVLARALSFADEAVNVAFPSPNPNPKLPSFSGPILAPSPNAWLLLFQLRRAQSQWYSTLFQCDASPMPHPREYLYGMCHDLHEWGSKLPDTLPSNTREMFDLELRYSYVYCFAPNARNPHMTDYGRVFIFEHTIAYLDAVHDIAHRGSNTAFYTCHDALRVYFMASQLLAVLRDAEDVILSGNPVPPLPLDSQQHFYQEMVVKNGIYAPPPPPPPPPPPIPADRAMRTTKDHVTKTISCLKRVVETLSKWGERWTDSQALCESFKCLATPVIERLEARKSMVPGLLPHYSQQRHQQQHQQQQQQQKQHPQPSRLQHNPQHQQLQLQQHQQHLQHNPQLQQDQHLQLTPMRPIMQHMSAPPMQPQLHMAPHGHHFNEVNAANVTASGPWTNMTTGLMGPLNGSTHSQ